MRSISQAARAVSKRVVVVVGASKNAFTGSATNTYLVGSGKRRWLIDPGEGSAAHVDAVRTAMKATGGESLGGILLTHWHVDHCQGVPQFLSAFGAAVPVHKVEGRYLPWLKYSNIKDRDVWLVDDDTTLQALLTPGHTSDHACFTVLQEDTMFTGDAVLGAPNDDIALRTPVEDLGAHLKSLRRIALMRPHTLLPGHGEPVVTDGTDIINRMVVAEDERARRISAILEGAVASPGLTAQQIAERLFKGAAAPSDSALRESAHGLVLQHLIELEKGGTVTHTESAPKAEAAAMKGPGGLTMTQVHQLLQQSTAKDRQLQSSHAPAAFHELDAAHAQLKSKQPWRWHYKSR